MLEAVPVMSGSKKSCCLLCDSSDDCRAKVVQYVASEPRTDSVVVGNRLMNDREVNGRVHLRREGNSGRSILPLTSARQ